MDANAILLIIASGGFITGLAAIITAVLTSRNTARRDEVESLRETITSLQSENERLTKRVQYINDRLEERQGEVNSLRETVRVLQSENQRLTDRMSALTDRTVFLEAENHGLHDELRMKSDKRKPAAPVVSGESE